MGLPGFPSIAVIHTYEPAAFFAILYAALALLYVWKTARNPAQAFIVLVIFCIFRIVGFILRAVLAASDGAKENDGLAIAETVFFSLGYVGILYSVFILILNRTDATRGVLGEDEDQPSGIIGFVLGRRIIDLTFTAAAGVAIASASYIGNDWDMSERLRKVTIILDLDITICLSINAAILVYKEKKALTLGLRQPAPTEQPYAVYALCPILLLLLIRQAYLVGTFNSDRHNTESLWYSLFAAPEFLAACLFSVRGLVPPPGEPSEEDEKRSYWSRLWKAYNTRI